MASSEERIERVFKKLQEYADQRNVRIGDGLLIGLVNYSTNLGVSDLNDNDVERVLCTLGNISIDLVAAGYVQPKIANGHVLSRVLRILCGPYDCCKKASELILGRDIDIGIRGKEMNPTDEVVKVSKFPLTDFIRGRFQDRADRTHNG